MTDQNKNKDDNSLYSSNEMEVMEKESGVITEQDRLLAGKQILLGLAILYAFTGVLYILNPSEGAVLLEVCKIVFPPLATLILVFYFKDKGC